jgi:protein ImuB
MASSRFIAVFNHDLRKLLVLARQLTPRVEMHPPDGLILEVTPRAEKEVLTRLLSLCPGLATGVAGTRSTALMVAKMSPGLSLAPGTEADFMADLPPSLLRLLDDNPRLPDTLLALSRWGIRTLGQLAALPSNELGSRLGQESLNLQRLARGEDLEPFEEARTEPAFEAALDLEYGLDSLEPLSFILTGLLDPLCEELQSRGLAADSVEVGLKLENGQVSERRVQFAFPLHHARTILALLRLELQYQSETARIVGVFIRLNPVARRIFQHSLFEPLHPAPEKLARTMGRLAALFGKENVGSPVVLNTYRPDAFQLVEFAPFRGNRCQSAFTVESQAAGLVLRRFRPPLPARIRAEQTRSWAGPWRTSGEWWAPTRWDREEWDVEFINGTVYRVFFDQRKKAWFLDGVYD